MQNWKDLYLEVAEIMAEIDAIRWVDLWHNQVGFLEDEHQFPTPAVFLSFRSLNIEDMSELMQNVKIQMEVYLYYETLTDTYNGSFNQGSALDFLDIMNSIFSALHGTTGHHYNEMRRVGFSAVDTGSGGNLYQMIFECQLVEMAAKKVYHKSEAVEMDIERGQVPPVDTDYQLPVFTP